MSRIPASWKCLRLEEVCAFHRGLTYSKKDETDVSSNAVLRANNVSLETGELDLAEIRYIDDQIEIPSHKMVRKGSLLVCMASGSKKHLGKVALIDEDYPYAFGGFMGLLVPNTAVDPKYLYWITRSKGYSDFIMGLSDGANINNLKFSQLGQYRIPVPPIPEQKRIVAVLDEAFAGIATAVANTEKNLANARELFESYLNSVFNQRGEGWEDTRLSEVCTLSSGGTPSKKKASYWNGDIPWVSGRDMKSTRLSDSALHVSEAAVKESSTRVAPAGTILVLVRGMGLAHGAQLAELIAPCAFNQDIRGVHPNSNMVPRFLLFALRDRINSSDRVLRSAAHGTLKLDSTELVNLVIPVPPVSQQEQIVADVDRIAEESLHLKTIYQQKLNALSELKQSLLQKAFSGELTTAPPDEIETALA